MDNSIYNELANNYKIAYMTIYFLSLIIIISITIKKNKTIQYNTIIPIFNKNNKHTLLYYY